MKNYIFLLITCLCLLGCSKEPTQAQLELVDRLIQEQIDIPHAEPNFDTAKELLLKNGETVKQATDRNKILYAEIHDFLVALQNKPYKDKKAWAINYLEHTIDLWESTMNSIENPDEEIVLRHEQRKKWLTILKD